MVGLDSISISQQYGMVGLDNSSISQDDMAGLDSRYISQQDDVAFWCCSEVVGACRTDAGSTAADLMQLLLSCCCSSKYKIKLNALSKADVWGKKNCMDPFVQFCRA